MSRSVFLLVGPPGAGKGSLSRLCVDNLGWRQISTGNLCRKHIQEQTKVGKEIAFAIESGKLVSDSLVTQMIADWLAEQNGNEMLILDGYPRTVAQAEMFQQLCNDRFPSLKITIVRLVISDQEVVERLSSRLVCTNKGCQAVYSSRVRELGSREKDKCEKCNASLGQRADDTPAAITERLKTYYKHEQPLVTAFRSMGHEVRELDVNKPLDLVFDSMCKTEGVTHDCSKK